MGKFKHSSKDGGRVEIGSKTPLNSLKVSTFMKKS